VTLTFLSTTSSHVRQIKESVTDEVKSHRRSRCEGRAAEDADARPKKATTCCCSAGSVGGISTITRGAFGSAVSATSRWMSQSSGERLINIT